MSKPRIAVVGIPGKWSTETLADALEARTGYRLVVDMADVWADFGSGKLLAGQTDLCELDGIIIKKISASYSPNALDRIELLRLPEAQGVRVFSAPQTVVRMVDRLACTMTLNAGGVPMPDTVVTERTAVAVEAVAAFGEAILKPMYSTKAQGMKIVSSSMSAERLQVEIDEFRATNPCMYIQRKRELHGRDYGAVFLGGEYLGTYGRVSAEGSWNTTIRSGGRYVAHHPPQSMIDLASRAQGLFGMDFTTVDVADTDDGPVVFEVSAFGGFGGARDGLGIDAAALYADYAIKEVRK